MRLWVSTCERREKAAPAAEFGDVERAAAGADRARLADGTALAAAVVELDRADRKRRADQRYEAAAVGRVHLPDFDVDRMPVVLADGHEPRPRRPCAGQRMQ